MENKIKNILYILRNKTQEEYAFLIDDIENKINNDEIIKLEQESTIESLKEDINNRVEELNELEEQYNELKERYNDVIEKINSINNDYDFED